MTSSKYWPRFHCRTLGWSALVIVFCLLLSPGYAADAAANDYARSPRAAQPVLIDLWFVLENFESVAWPYAFIRHRETGESQNVRAYNLVEELDNLIWRLRAAHFSPLAQALTQWRDRIARADDFRTPGRWGPAALLANPRNRPPVSAIAAIGTCPVPGWVQIWDRHGVRRIDWLPGMRLSTLLDDDGALHGANVDTVTLVTPQGENHERGVAAWNYRDAPVSPGTRIIVPLPLDGQASVWIHNALTEFLSHLVPGERCRQFILKPESAPDAR